MRLKQNRKGSPTTPKMFLRGLIRVFWYAHDAVGQEGSHDVKTRSVAQLGTEKSIEPVP